MSSKEHRNEIKRLWVAKNKDKVKELLRQSHLRHKKTRNEHKREYRKKNHDLVVEREGRSKLYSRYGITLEEKESLWLNQQKRCLICLRDISLKFSSCVDHDHKSGIVRGILCRSCNQLVGWIEQDRSRVDRAIKYLKLNA